MRLPSHVYRKVEDADVSVQFACNGTIKLWNSLEQHFTGDGRRKWYAGWYWFPSWSNDGPFGPFRSMSAAYRDAFKSLPR